MNNTPTSPDIELLNITRQFEDYLRKKFRALLRGDEIHVPFPTHWTLDLLSEVDRIALILVQAFRNPSETGFSLYHTLLIEPSSDIVGRQSVL